MNLRHLALSAAPLLLIAGTANAATLYDQPVLPGGNAWASHNDPGINGPYGTAYDDFVLGSAAHITGVSFTGLYFPGSVAGNITNFAISVYADNAGQPGASIYSVNIPGTPVETPTGFSLTFGYSFDMDFMASGGTRYWLSVVPTMLFPPQWGWSEGTGGNGSLYQDFFGSRNEIAADLAFTLTGDVTSGAVPEPATWAMLIIGFGAVGFAARRRREAATA